MDINYDNFAQRFKEKELTEAKDTDRYILYGVWRYKHRDSIDEDKRAVAEFSSKKLANDYIKNSKMKNPPFVSSRSTESIFKKRSLLDGASDAFIEVKDGDLPLNPK